MLQLQETWSFHCLLSRVTEGQVEEGELLERELLEQAKKESHGNMG